MSVMTENAYIEHIDKSYVGLYAFDAKCFEKQQPLHVLIDVEGNDADRKIRFPYSYPQN
ncbi:MAG: hypothetical protein U0003_05950 [Vampirovibrionales bacterium]